uniref:GDSL esterase/lipase n=1 Tax=Aegilops tauschii TaxID=37682 RepID=R7VZ26_AEGTA
MGVVSASEARGGGRSSCPVRGHRGVACAGEPEQLPLLPCPWPTAPPPAPANQSSCYKRLFSFGDSLIDTGNYIVHFSATPGPVVELPYGETFFGRPTGRWSDGRLIVDFIVERLGFPYWPAYLQAAAGKSPAEEFRYGVNFAVGSATALSQDFFRKKRLRVDLMPPYSLDVQIGLFKKVVAVLGSTDQERKAAMASSLFLVGEIGANDYIQPLFQNKTLEWVRPLVPRIIRSIALSIEALIELGAKTMYVPGIFPMGCTPLFLGIFPGDDRDPATGCLRWLNDLTLVHNHMLKSQLDELRRNHPGVSITYVDYYEEMLSLVTKPVENGFAAETVLDACYPVFVPGRGVVRCPDPSRYVSWDGVHLTEAAYKIMAHGMLDGPFAMPPIMSTCNRNC